MWNCNYHWTICLRKTIISDVIFKNYPKDVLAILNVPLIKWPYSVMPICHTINNLAYKL